MKLLLASDKMFCTKECCRHYYCGVTLLLWDICTQFSFTNITADVDDAFKFTVFIFTLLCMHIGIILQYVFPEAIMGTSTTGVA